MVLFKKSILNLLIKKIEKNESFVSAQLQKAKISARYIVKEYFKIFDIFDTSPLVTTMNNYTDTKIFAVYLTKKIKDIMLVIPQDLIEIETLKAYQANQALVNDLLEQNSDFIEVLELLEASSSNVVDYLDYSLEKAMHMILDSTPRIVFMYLLKVLIEQSFEVVKEVKDGDLLL